MMSYNIFIVEEDPIIAGSVRDFLTRYGYRVMKGLAPATRAIGGHFSPPDWSGTADGHVFPTVSLQVLLISFDAYKSI
jgi:hypothetical protein